MKLFLKFVKIKCYFFVDFHLLLQFCFKVKNKF